MIPILTSRGESNPGPERRSDAGILRITGIWQSVWLEYVGKVHLKRVKYTPDVSSLSVLCEVFVSDTEDTMVELTARTQKDSIFLGSQRLLCRHGYGKAVVTLPDYDIRRNELLWTPEEPNLIDVCVKVFSGDASGAEVCEDEVEDLLV